MLDASSGYGTAQILAAIKHQTVNADIERARANLLTRKDDPVASTDPAYQGLTVAAVAGLSVTPHKAALLSAVAREFAPKCVLELGTNVGVSAAYIASVIPGTITTIEVSVDRQAVAKQLHDELDIRNSSFVLGRFGDVLPETLARIGPVDMAFIDGDHYHQPTLEYFEQVVSNAAPGAVFVFDDVRWSDGMSTAWATLKQDSRFGLVVDFYSWGVCVLGDGRKRVVTPPIVI